MKVKKKSLVGEGKREKKQAVLEGDTKSEGERSVALS